MNKNIISVASSVSADKNFDPLDTLLFCIESNIKMVQLYMDTKLSTNNKLIEKIALLAKNNNIEITCHAPSFLGNEPLSENITFALTLLFVYQNAKKVIIHFDENTSIKETINAISSLNNLGFTVCIENFYKDKHIDCVMNNISKYLILLTLCQKDNFDIIPVIDIPRLFIKEIYETCNSLLLTKIILHTITNLSNDIILHLIDTSNHSQERDTWVPIGIGIIPYNQIFKTITDCKIKINHIVLEYETKNNALDSIEYLGKI